MEIDIMIQDNFKDMLDVTIKVYATHLFKKFHANEEAKNVIVFKCKRSGATLRLIILNNTKEPEIWQQSLKELGYNKILKDIKNELEKKPVEYD